MEKSVFNRTVQFLRKQFTWSENYIAVKTRCKVGRNAYRCEACSGIACKSEADYEANKALVEASPEFFDHIACESFAIDHIEPVGSLESLDQAYSRIFCDINNLMGLCYFCHRSKTVCDLQDIKKKKYNLIESIENKTLE